jgi:hypothetical protein
MVSRLDCHRVALLLVASAAFSACSSGNGATQDVPSGNDAEAGTGAQALHDARAPDDAPTDAGTNTLEADATVGVWAADSSGFTLTYGNSLSGPADASCSDLVETWTYDVASRVLTWRGCFGSTVVTPRVVLSPASVTELTARLSALTTTGRRPPMDCGPPDPVSPAPVIGLTVFGPGGAQRGYESDYYSGCQDLDAGAGPFVSEDDLLDLEDDLEAYVLGCVTDGGIDGDAGASCAPAVTDAGDGD